MTGIRATAGRYALSLGAGVAAGLLYWLMGVRSPAPPWRHCSACSPSWRARAGCAVC